ncbi:MAG: ABC transporter substrate-binding protein [Ruthenibacterium sp.]
MTNTKRILSLALSAVLMLSLVACGAPAASAVQSSASAVSAPASASDTLTITDHLGNSVTVPRTIKRIAVCDLFPLPSVLSVFFDSAEKIVGMAPPSMSAAKSSLLSELYPEILNAETGFIDGTNVNTEELLKLAPDVVFYSAASKELGEKLTAAGFNAVAISVSKWDYDAIETLNQWILLLSEIFPENAKADIVAAYSAKTYDRVQERIKTLTDDERARAFFLFQYSDASISTSGKHFFGQWWADAIGAKNVGEELDKDNSAAVNMEQLYAWNPDLIFITNFNISQPKDLYENGVGNYDWSGIAAVQNKRVYKMPLGMYRSYTCGVDTPVTLLWLAKTAYPDLFSDVNITQEAKDYYKAVFGIALTDAQAEMIFTPSSAAGTGFAAGK